LCVGVDYIIHVASPFHFNVTDHQKDFYEPAIHGTTGILKEAAKEKSVKRVVITSSFAAVVNPAKYPPSILQPLTSAGEPGQATSTAVPSSKSLC
jgi:nucleoside-diphosphate-sugar epimerase